MLIFLMYTMRKKVILVLNKGPREELDDAAITTEAKYSVNITKLRKKCFFSLHNNATNSFWYV